MGLRCSIFLLGMVPFFAFCRRFYLVLSSSSSSSGVVRKAKLYNVDSNGCGCSASSVLCKKESSSDYIKGLSVPEAICIVIQTDLDYFGKKFVSDERAELFRGLYKLQGFRPMKPRSQYLSGKVVTKPLQRRIPGRRVLLRTILNFEFQRRWRMGCVKKACSGICCY